MDHLYWDLGSCAGGALFEIALNGSAARVCLMTGDDYHAYLDGDSYVHYGGFYDRSPVVLEVPHDGLWVLVVDSNRQRISVRVEQVFD
jgi:uncharacterized protein DUF1883